MNNLKLPILVFAPVIAATLLLASPASAQFNLRPQQGQPRTAEQLTNIRVMIDGEDIMPSETVHLAVIFSIEPKWHLYWKNPGEGAMAPRIKISAPDGFTIGETHWPRPIVLPSPVGDMYSYEDEFALFVPVTAPDDLGDGEAAFKVEISFAVCDKEMCLFGTVERTARVPTTSSTARTLQARRSHPLIAKHRPRLARSLSDEGGRATQRNDQLRIVTPVTEHDEISFIPLESPGVEYGDPAITRRGNRFEVMISLNINENNFLGGPPNIGGLIMMGASVDDPSYEFSMPLRQSETDFTGQTN
jgi:DsbC/DsbD-like thiol-disulfide interchange protein